MDSLVPPGHQVPWQPVTRALCSRDIQFRRRSSSRSLYPVVRSVSIPVSCLELASSPQTVRGSPRRSTSWARRFNPVPPLREAPRQLSTRQGSRCTAPGRGKSPATSPGMSIVAREGGLLNRNTTPISGSYSTWFRDFDPLRSGSNDRGESRSRRKVP